MTTITSADQQRIARATLTYLAEPADPMVCGLLQILSPAELVASIRSGSIPTRVTGVPGGLPAARATLTHCRGQLHRVPADAGLAGLQQRGARLVCPGDTDWPGQLEDLGVSRPYALWVRGADGPAWVPAASARWPSWAAGLPPPTALTSPQKSPPASAARAGP